MVPHQIVCSKKARLALPLLSALHDDDQSHRDAS